MNTNFTYRFRNIIQACAVITMAAAAMLVYAPKAGAQLFYFTNSGDMTIRSMNSAGQPTIFADYGYPTSYGDSALEIGGLAFDPSGNLYVAASFYMGSSTPPCYIIKIAPDGMQSTYQSLGAVNPPEALAFDSSGDLYRTGAASGGCIIETTPQGASSTLAAHLGKLDVGYITVDAADNVYVAGFYDNIVYEISSAGQVSTFASISKPDGVSLDMSGNLFVTYSLKGSGHALTEVSPSGTQTVLAGDLGPIGADYVDSIGDVYLSEYSDNEIEEYSSTGLISSFSQGVSDPQDLIGPSPANTIELSIQPSPAAGGVHTTGTVTLSAPAPVLTHVRVSSSDTSVATVPVGVTIRAGQRSANFTINTVASTLEGSSTIVAKVGSKSQSAQVIALATQIGIFSFKPAAVTGGSSSTGTVKLNGPAPSGGAEILVGGASTYASFPSSILIPAGQTSGSFTVTTTAVPSIVHDKFGVSYNGNDQSAFLTINP